MSIKHIMVVDDSAVMRMIISNILMKNPMFQVSFATNGKEATEAIKTEKPDLILLDIEMPEMNGLEFLRFARLRCRSKICILSSIASAGSKAAREAVALGADGVICKPSGAVSYDLEQKTGEELMSTINRLLSL